MTLTVNQAFRIFRSNLEITDLQESTVSDRQTRIRNVLQRDLSVDDSFLSGSYRRQTLIAPLKEADVDIIIVLNDLYRSRGARNVLDLVRRTLLKSYRTPKISRNGQAITITFSDFMVDVVPAFLVPQWGEPLWDICDSSSDYWIRTNPKNHIKRSSQVNQDTGGLLVPTVKMLKSWNRNASRPLRSFHLEAQAWKIFDPGALITSYWGPGATMGEDWENVQKFFREAQSHLRKRLPDPSGTSADIGAYLTGAKLDSAVSKVTTALSRCQRAENSMDQGQHSVALGLYRQIFGAAFPGQ